MLFLPVSLLLALASLWIVQGRSTSSLQRHIFLFGYLEHFAHKDTLRSQVIADNVGDNVGDIAGMGADLFGSFAESTCAALVVSSISSFGTDRNFVAMSFPLIISAAGIFVCLLTTLVATDICSVKGVKEIEPALKNQLIISTILMTGAIAVVCYFGLPETFTINVIGHEPKIVKNWYEILFDRTPLA